jgi:hypothetical protein
MPKAQAMVAVARPPAPVNRFAGLTPTSAAETAKRPSACGMIKGEIASPADADPIQFQALALELRRRYFELIG